MGVDRVEWNGLIVKNVDEWPLDSASFHWYRRKFSNPLWCCREKFGEITRIYKNSFCNIPEMIMTNGLTTKSAASVYSKLYKSILERVLSDMFRDSNRSIYWQLSKIHLHMNHGDVLKITKTKAVFDQIIKIYLKSKPFCWCILKNLYTFHSSILTTWTWL